MPYATYVLMLSAAIDSKLCARSAWTSTSQGATRLFRCYVTAAELVFAKLAVAAMIMQSRIMRS